MNIKSQGDKIVDSLFKLVKSKNKRVYINEGQIQNVKTALDKAESELR